MHASPPAPPPGLVVGGYTLLSRLGEGGMGVVHLAQRPGGPRVALKVLRPHIVGDDEARRRLEREVGSLSRIRSPRIAEIVDADPYGPIPYVATRYVPGLSLHDHVHQEGVVEGTDLVHLAAGLAEALAAVHACGVLHRDIKPSNVLMEGRNPVLIDFGLARVADDPKLTHTGWLLGTPGYLAPEILYGDDATTASDVHSWAACVAYAGTGRPPFGRGPGMAIMDRVRRGEHRIDGLSPAMTELVAQALSPEPHQRPTLPEVIAQLRPVGAWGDAETQSMAAVDDDPFTVPLAVAAQAGAEALTERTTRPPVPEGSAPGAGVVDPNAPEPGGQPRPTRPYTAHAPGLHAVPSRPAGSGPSHLPVHPSRTSQPGQPGRPGPWPGPAGLPLPAARASFGLRLRRGLTFVGLAGVAAASVAAVPYLAAGMLALLVWLLRSGSFAATASGSRRALRGRKWFDGIQTAFSSPWHLGRGVPGTLLLVGWGGCMGLAGALLGYAAGFSVVGILGVAGAMYAVSLGLGPGSDRVRAPLRRAIHPLADRLPGWALVTFALFVAAGLIGGIAQSRGAEWAPAQTGPFDSLVDQARNALP